ncbi:MAG: hypothetical protein OEU54_04655 [Gemmatimonadota bacterium]|nr:hypothetical protein [Gemmatimonadota bacterium]
MDTRRSLLLVLPLAFSGCTSDPATEASEDYDLVTDVQGLMLTVLEPAAETYWDAVGAILDSTGVDEFQPETEEEWEQVRHAAYVIAESGNLLMMRGRALDRGAWMAFSRDLVEIGREAIAAAEAMDAEAVFTAGGEVYLVCSACHASYALQTLRPNDDRTDPVEVEGVEDAAEAEGPDGSGS